MNRRDFIKTCAITAVVFGMGGCRGTTLSYAAPPARPNIILCMTDDQGWGDVSYNGLTHVKTPNLDSMAAAGMRFNRFYAHQSCSPARACAMTGRHPNRIGVFWPGMRMRTQETTIAQTAKLAGYATAHFGKWHLNGVPGRGKPIKTTDPLSPVRLGFDEFFSVTNWYDKDWTFSRQNGELVKVPGDGSIAIVAEALKFMGRSKGQSKPFLAVIWFGSPHGPHRPTDEHKRAAGGSSYYGEIVEIDRSMGALRAGLRSLGIAENTMLWFSSDNGGWPNAKNPAEGGSNGPFRGRKGDMWEGGIRVPGLIEWPARIKKPVVTEVPVGLTDIHLTLVDLLGVDNPNMVGPSDGISILPLLDGKMKERPKPMGFWQYDDRRPQFDTNSGPSAWNDNRYKLVKPKPDTWELYDLVLDPSEKKDVSAEHPEILNRMKAELDTWQRSVIRSFHGNDYPGGLPKVK